MMNAQIEEEGRYITTILDPHIKVADDYFVYYEGKDLEGSHSSSTFNIFVKNDTGRFDFEGFCWPGNSVWIDFLNENA